MFREIRNLIEQIQRDFERGRATGCSLAPMLFWSWVLFAWCGIGAFLVYCCFVVGSVLRNVTV